MNVNSVALNSLHHAFDRLNKVATKVATAASPEGGGDLITFSDAAVELSQAKVEAATSVKVIKAENDLMKYTLDILA
jgi:hypothetical protein